jgi:hypothetical protein
VESDTFVVQVMRHFRHLIDDYGLQVSSRRYDPDVMGNSVIILKSTKLSIQVLLDRGQVTLDMAAPSASVGPWFSLVRVLKCLGVEGSEAEYEFPETWDNYDAMIDLQVVRLARLVQQYCGDIVSGKLSIWNDLGSQGFDQALADYRRIVGRDPIVIQHERLSERIRQEEARRASGSSRGSATK